MSIDAHIPLGALRVFEVAGRHLSFTRAAEELFVTQAAVSHQIRRLEEFLGVRLFRRLNRSLLLTDAGQTLLPQVRDALTQLDTAVKQVATRGDGKRLSISLLPSLASRWLVPRLGTFIARHPDLDLRLAPSNDLTNFDRDDVDCVIRYGGGNYPGLTVHFLFGEAHSPVCSPALLGRLGPLEQPLDLARYTLLHDDDRNAWLQWLKLADATQVDGNRGPVFTDAGMMIQAAVAGHGVALARNALAEQDVAAGRLVKLFELDRPTRNAYYLIYPPHHESRPGVQAFKAWLLEQSARELQPEI